MLAVARRGDTYMLDGKKWWTTGACDPRCAVAIFMGKSDTGAARHRQQSMVLVPMDALGVNLQPTLLALPYLLASSVEAPPHRAEQLT